MAKNLLARMLLSQYGACRVLEDVTNASKLLRQFTSVVFLKLHPVKCLASCLFEEMLSSLCVGTPLISPEAVSISRS